MMKEYYIGINTLHGTLPHNFECAIKAVIESGFDCMEIGLSELPLIIGGKVCWSYVQYVKQILERHPIKYTAHITAGLDLRNLEEYDLHKQVLLSSIDVCNALGIECLTLHFEQASRVAKEEQAFFKAHVEAAEYAAKKQVLLALENIEVEDHRKVVCMLKKIDHPNLRMNLDIGHLNLSTHYFGGDFKEAVEECAPLVRHVHLSDNVGRFQKMRLENFYLYKTIPMGVRTAFGAGDVHLPPLWGEIDTRFAIETLHKANYKGVFLCEYQNELYVPFQGKIQADVRALVKEIYGE